MSGDDALGGARRILVYGVTGSGKSTTAAAIGRRTGLPAHMVDDLTWEPGWVPVPPEEQRRRIAEICAQPAWVLDSAYGRWLDVVLPRVDLVIALDLPRWFSLQRLVRRTVGRIVTREPVCNGNRETARNQLSADSIVVWHFRSFRRKRKRMRAWERSPEGPEVLRFTSAGPVQRWLDALHPVTDLGGLDDTGPDRPELVPRPDAGE